MDEELLKAFRDMYCEIHDLYEDVRTNSNVDVELSLRDIVRNGCETLKRFGVIE